MWNALRRANLSPPTSSAPSQSQSTPSTEPSRLFHYVDHSFESSSAIEPSLPEYSESSSQSLLHEGKSVSNEIKTLSSFIGKTRTY